MIDPACGTGGFLTSVIEHVRRNEVHTAEDERLIKKTIRGTELKPLPFMLCVTNMLLHGIKAPTNIRHGDSLARPIKDITPEERVDCIVANPPFGATVKDGIMANFPADLRTKETADLFLVLFLKLLKPGGKAGIVLPDGSLTGDGVKARIRQKWLEECNLHTIIRLPNTVFAPYATVAANLLFFEKGKKTKDVWYYEHRLPEGVKAYSKTKPIRVEEFAPIKKWWNKRTVSEVAWKVSIKDIEQRGWDLDIKNPNKKEELTNHSSADLITKLEESFVKSKEILADLKKEI